MLIFYIISMPLEMTKIVNITRKSKYFVTYGFNDQSNIAIAIYIYIAPQ